MSLFDFELQLPITDPTWIFFLVLVVILFAPIILERLRIPHIIGMILAGVLLGEHGFNILARDSSFELFGKVGLYYIMFLAGLCWLSLSRWASASGRTCISWTTPSSLPCCLPACMPRTH